MNENIEINGLHKRRDSYYDANEEMWKGKKIADKFSSSL